MRLLSVIFIVLLTLLTVYIANNSSSHTPTSSDNSDDPMSWTEPDGVRYVHYWKGENDDFDNMDHSTTSAYTSATRALRYPNQSSSKRLERAWAYASVSSKDVADEVIVDGEYCLYTKIIFQDKTGFIQGDDTVAIGDNSTISEGWEYYNIVNFGEPGTDFTGAQNFSDSANYSTEVKGNNRLAAIAKSWMENNFQNHDMGWDTAAAKVWL